jgi:hypothetical protein
MCFTNTIHLVPTYCAAVNLQGLVLSQGIVRVSSTEVEPPEVQGDGSVSGIHQAPDRLAEIYASPSGLSIPRKGLIAHNWSEGEAIREAMSGLGIPLVHHTAMIVQCGSGRGGLKFHSDWS